MPSLTTRIPDTLSSLRIIARLKLLLTVRSYKRQVVNAIGMGVMLVAMLLFALFGGGALIYFTHSAEPALRGRIIAWACWILAILWINAPLMQFDSAKNLDLNGLRLLPLKPATFTAAVMLDAVLAPLGLALLLWIAIFIAAFSQSLALLPLAALVVLLLASAIVSTGQAIFLFASNLLSSRRFTDASLIVGLFLFMLFQSLNMLLQVGVRQNLPPWLLALYEALRETLVPLARWIFPGLSAQVLEDAGRSDWLAASGKLAFLAAQCGVCIFAAGAAARQFYLGEIESGGSTAKGKETVRPLKGAAAGLGRLLSGAGPALFHRERIYLWRDPVLKMLFMQTVLGAVWMSAMFIFAGHNIVREERHAPISGLGHWLVFAIAMFLGLIESSVLFNKFGYEGPFSTVLLLSPVSRIALLRSKSLFLISHFAAVNMLLVGGVALALRVPLPQAVAAMLLVLCNTVVADSAGNFVSVYFPFTYQRVGRRLRMVPAQAGCGFMFIYSLVTQACNLAVLPGSAALILGSVFYGWGGLAAGAAIAGLLAYLAHVLSLPRAAAALLAREPELIVALTKPPG